MELPFSVRPSAIRQKFERSYEIRSSIFSYRAGEGEVQWQPRRSMASEGCGRGLPGSTRGGVGGAKGEAERRSRLVSSASYARRQSDPLLRPHPRSCRDDRRLAPSAAANKTYQRAIRSPSCGSTSAPIVRKTCKSQVELADHDFDR